MADNDPEFQADLPSRDSPGRRRSGSSGGVNIYDRPEPSIFQRHPVPIIIVSLAALVAITLVVSYVI